MESESGKEAPMPAHLVPGRIIWVDIPDPAGRNPKQRPVVVLQHQARANGEVEVIGVAVTGTFPKRLPCDHVEIPSHPGGRCRTGLYERSAAVCSWIVRLTFPSEAEISVGGFVPGDKLKAIVAKVNELAAPPGGEAEEQGPSAGS
jgi:hypothetical protein